MKIRQLTRLAAVIAFCAIASAACSKSATNTNSTGNSNSPTVAKGELSTPTATFRSFYEAAKSGDAEGLKRALSAKTMEMAQKAAAKENKPVDEALKESVKDAPAVAPETRNEKIDGDTATLEFKDEKSDKWTTVKFVRENGQWKIALLEDMAAEMERLEKLETEKK